MRPFEGRALPFWMLLALAAMAAWTVFAGMLRVLELDLEGLPVVTVPGPGPQIDPEKSLPWIGERAPFLRGRVVGPDGSPVARAWITYAPVLHGDYVRRERLFWGLHPALDGERLPPPLMTVTDPDGRFQLTGVPRSPGLELLVDAKGLAPLKRHDLIVPRDGLDLGTVVLEIGATVTGIVRDPADRPVEGARVLFCEVDRYGTSWRFGQGLITRSGRRRTVTDEEGRYRLEGIPVRDGWLVVEASGFVRATLGLSSPLNATGGLEVLESGPERTIDLRLDSGRKIQGVVRGPP